MPGNSFGQIFRITTWGESHGGAVGVVVDGCPPGLEINEDIIQADLDRRRPGQSSITTPREETDRVKILSGTFKGQTTGTPILLLVWNKDARSDDYLGFSKMFRPGHADFTYEKKYGIRNWQGGGRSSARETIGRVAAAAVAKKFLQSRTSLEVVGFVQRVADIQIDLDPSEVEASQVESNIVRCPDSKKAKEMEILITKAKEEGDSLGGVVGCSIRQVPIGLGEPVFDKLDADLAKACLSIPATKGFEVGSGFGGTMMKGSTHNDPFEVGEDGQITTSSNNAGGLLGGISSGQDINLRIAFKPVSTIGKEQKTVTVEGRPTSIAARGRHDPCVLPRAVPIVESMVWLVLMDHYLRFQAQCQS